MKFIIIFNEYIKKLTYAVVVSLPKGMDRSQQNPLPSNFIALKMLMIITIIVVMKIKMIDLIKVIK